MDSTVIFYDEETELRKWLNCELDKTRETYEDSIKHIKECELMMGVAKEVKNNWEESSDERQACIYFEACYSWEGQGFKITLVLGKEDNIKSVSGFLRPIKFDPNLIYKKEYVNQESGIVGADYEDTNCSRILELRIDLGMSKLCRQVQVGVKEVPVYEIKCDEGNEVKELINDEIGTLLRKET